MAKKTQTPETEQKDTDVALLKIDWLPPAEFKLPNKDESLAIIKAKRDANAKLVIAGVEDKTSYEAVKVAMGEMKNSRIALVDAATTNVITPATNYLSKFKEDLALIVEEFKAGEKDMRDKKDAIDEEKERIKVEKALAAQRAMEARINNLFVLGAIISNSVYSFPYDSSLVINSIQIKEFDDEEFGEFLEEVKTAWTVEQDRIAEENRLAEEAEQEQAAMAQRNLEQSQQINEQAKQLTEKRTKLRIKELQLLGAHPVESESNIAIMIARPQGNDRVCDMAFVQQAPDEEWDILIASIENYVEPVDVSTDAPSEDEVDRVYPMTEEEATPAVPVSDTNPIVLEEMRFDSNSPYREIKISGTFRMRIFPDAYEAIALDGINVVNQGVLQPRINWIVFK